MVVEPSVVVLAAAVLLFGLVSRPIDRSPLTGPILFTGLGLLAGQAGLGVLDLAVDGEVVTVLTEVTLSLVLFTHAARMDLPRLRTSAALPARMLLSLPLVIALGAAAGMWLLGLDLATAALLGAVLAPTDAALGQAVVSDERLPVRIRQTLNVESGLNDGIMVPFVTVLLAVVAGEGEAMGPGEIIGQAAGQLAVGVLVGLAVGAGGAWAIERASDRDWMTSGWQQIATLACALLAAGGSSAAGGNEFVAAFVGGMAFGAIAHRRCAGVYAFAEEEGRLLTLLVFVVFGASLAPDLHGRLGWAEVGYVVASLTVVRMVPIALSLLGIGLRPDSVAFLGWFGPRGLASILFLLLVVEELGEQGAAPVAGVAVWTVGTSILVHGASAVPLVGAYSRLLSASTGSDLPEMAPTEAFHAR